MAEQTKATIKEYFQTGDKPTQEQFEVWIDSIVFILDEIVDNFSSTDAKKVLSAAAGKVLNDDVQTHKGATNPHAIDSDTVNCIPKDNTTSYTPTTNYHPSTKKYVDETATQIFNEAPTGDINGSNKVYTTNYNFVVETTRLYLNGNRQTYGIDYTETGTNEITFSTYFPDSPDKLRIDYQRNFS